MASCRPLHLFLVVVILSALLGFVYWLEPLQRLPSTSRLRSASNISGLVTKKNSQNATYARPLPDPPPYVAVSSSSNTNPKKPLQVFNPPASAFSNLTLLQYKDPLYTKGAGWDVAPIVIESHRLVFFTIPKVSCTVFKQLFRRMRGFPDWATDNSKKTHNPSANGLAYLYHFPPDVADQMLTGHNNSYTRAMFVRDPKERLLSAYLDKAVSTDYVRRKCCPKTYYGPRKDELPTTGNSPERKQMWELLDCKPPSKTTSADPLPNITFADFVLRVIPYCHDPHWAPQHERLPERYWTSPMDLLIGHFSQLYDDTRDLLERSGAWEDYGQSGWPGGGPIFAAAANKMVHHATDSHAKLRQYYTSAEIEAAVEELYRSDYENPVFNLTLQTIFVNAT